MRKIKKLFLLLLLFLPVGANAKAPRLIVMIAGDQIRADYMDRFHARLSPKGLRRFLEKGSYFTQARHERAVTTTAPGHVLYGSGIYAAESGIINNEWFDVESNTSVSGVEIIPAGERVRLKWFMGRSLAQRVHASLPKSRVVSISYKDRGALLFTGPDQDAAFWFDKKTSRYIGYHKSPAWLKTFNKTMSARKSFRDPEQSDPIVEKLAEATVREFKLGANPRGAPDILTVSFSAMDTVGHEHGPDSREIEEAFMRLDRSISDLIAYVERTVGTNVVWVFSSDHGVTPIPEASKRVHFSKSSVSNFEKIKNIAFPFIYINEGVSPQSVAKALKAVEGVEEVYLDSDLRKENAPRQVLRAYFKPPGLGPSRSGDMFVTLKPGYIHSGYKTGTTHGTMTDDDQRVPLAFYGKNVPKRVHTVPVSVARAAPTVLHILGLSSDGLEPPLSLE